MTAEQVEAALDRWHQMLFNQDAVMKAENWDEDDLCKAEENYAGRMEYDWTDADRKLLAELAQKRLIGKPLINPEDESQDREQRFIHLLR